MLTFSSLPMLALFPVVLGGLWYAYKRMGQAQRVTVGTTFYIKKLAGTSSSRRKFIPPWRFLIELFCLLLLVLAAAGVVISRDSKRVLIVIDDSRSMGAEVQGESLLALALSRASSMLGSSDDVAPSLLFTSYPDTIATGREVSSVLIEKDQRTVDTEDGLELLLPRLLADPKYDELWLFTDKELSGLPEKVKALALFGRESAPQNIGIVGLVQSGRSLKASLFRTGAGAETVKIGLKKFVAGKFETIFSGKSIKIIDTAEVDLGTLPDAPVEVSITAPLGSNAIKSDDSAWLVPERSKVFRLHGDLSPEAMKIDGFEFVSAATDSPLVVNDIFYKIDGESRGNALYVLAPSTLLPEAKVRKDPLSTWQVENPLLKYLFSADLSDIPFLPLNALVSDNVIAGSGAGAMLSSTKNTIRAVYAGIDLFPFDSKNVAKSILTLNILNWLTEARQTRNGAVLKTEEKYATTAGIAVLPPINTGLYLISDGAGLSAVNLFSAAESQVGLKSAIGRGAEGAKIKEAAPSGFEAWRVIVYLVLGLAVLDLVVSVISSIRRARA